MKIAPGIPTGQTDAAAALYWEAFGQKLRPVLGPDTRALRFVASVIDPHHAISATDSTGRLIGIVGFKTAKGALVGGSLMALAAVYGLSGALWRAGLLSLLARDTENTRFLTDGLCVASDARGRGTGTALLQALSTEARRRDYAELRLDVVDTNTRAAALYTRLGFRPVKTTSIGPLRHIFGYQHTITMVRPV